jgi:transcription elongation GreA/GreB family factor
MSSVSVGIQRQLQLLQAKRDSISQTIEELKRECNEEEYSVYSELEDQLKIIEDKIKRLSVSQKYYKDQKVARREVCLGDLVCIRKNGGDRECMTLVHSENANPQKGYISVESPLGRNLVRRKLGSEVVFNTPIGVQRIEIVR